MTATQTPWLTTEPPKDGTPIVAVGRIIWEDDFSTSVERFVSAIRWIKDSSGYEGWHHDTSDNMTVARYPEDDVLIDYWLPMPTNSELPTPDSELL